MQGGGEAMLGSGLLSGVGDAAALAELPARFDGAIWTNRIDRMDLCEKRRCKTSFCSMMGYDRQTKGR
jgi:hypothetical protein